MTWIVRVDGEGSANRMNEDSEDACILLTLRAQISNAGKLLLMPRVSYTDLRPASRILSGVDSTNFLDGQNVILSSSGQLARVVETPAVPSTGSAGRKADRRDLTDTSRSTQLSDDAKWKDYVRNNSPTHSMLDFSGDRWLRVKFTPRANGDPDTLRGTQTFLWPAALCFVNNSAYGAHTTDDVDYSAWFGAENGQTYQNPLRLAERWFSGKAERERASIARQQAQRAEEEREMALLRPPEIGDTGLPTSPLYPRSQDQAALAGVYPTPPDGLAHVLGTSSDSTAPAMTVTDGPTLQLDGPEANHQPERNHSIVSSVGLDAPSYRNNNADLFGDMDEDMFGGPDVTDADFSFFDDQNGPSFETFEQREQPAVESDAAADTKATKAGGGDLSGLLTEGQGPLIVKTSQSSISESALVADERQAAVEVPRHMGDVVQTPLKEEDATSPLGVKMNDNADSDDHALIPRLAATPPLSPFSIKERLLPVPIPASLKRAETQSPHGRASRRESTYDRIAFNQSLDSFESKYGPHGRFTSTITAPRQAEESHGTTQASGQPSPSRRLSIMLPPKGKRARTMNAPFTTRHVPGKSYDSYNDKALVVQDSDEESSEEDSFSDRDDAKSNSIASYNPFPSRKRKRDLDDVAMGRVVQSFDQLMSESEPESDAADVKNLPSDRGDLLDFLAAMEPVKQHDEADKHDDDEDVFLVEPPDLKHLSMGSPTSSLSEDLYHVFGFNPEDIVGVAQLLAEQNLEDLATPHSDAAAMISESGQLYGGPALATRAIAQAGLKSVFPSAAETDFAKLMTFTPNNERSAQPKSQPRPNLPRALSINGTPVPGQYVFPLQTPFVRLQRAEAAWEMLPSALTFWEALSLEPANGPKDVDPIVVFPANNDLEDTVAEFIDDLGTSYENCKLGSHKRGQTCPNHANNLVQFGVAEGQEVTPRSVLSALNATCSQLGKSLATDGSLVDDKTIVVYLVNPFSDQIMTKFVYGCFWSLLNAYRSTKTRPSADVILQVVSIGDIVLHNSLVIPDIARLSCLAREVYDRCPGKDIPDSTQAWRFPAAASVELATPLPRKINFALNESPPANLLQEANILHLAYAVSADNNWLTAAWTDNSGRNQYSCSYSLRGGPEAHYDMLSDLQTKTMNLASGRDSVWRLIIARVGEMSATELNSWESFSGSVSRFAVTVLDVDPDPALRITPPEPVAAKPIPGQGFPTPGSTPQTNVTVSPGENAPPTPAGSATEEQTQTQPADADAHLMDVTDESWGLILPFSVARPLSVYGQKRPLASGMLLKRGDGSSSSINNTSLPSLAVDIMRISPPQLAEGQAQWLTPRPPEFVCREILAWYRGLGLLAKLRGIRGVDGVEKGVVPWHVAVAVRGAKRLEGFVWRC